MNKIAWLITHDVTIDRRIYFFADALINNGYDVKLFGGIKHEINDEDEPKYVCRPEKMELVAEYSVEIDKLYPEERNIVKEISQSFEDQFNKTGRYALFSKRKKYNNIRVRYAGHGSSYSIVIYSEDSRIVIYNSGSDRCVVYRSLMDQKKVLGIMKLAMNIEAGAFLTNGKLQIVVEVNELEQRKIRLHEPGMPYSFIYNIETQKVYVCNSMPYTSIMEPCVLENQKFDYKEFRENVYDFTPILEKVKECIKEEKPNLVYVADLPTLPIGYMLKSTTDAKLIVDCHEWWYKQQELFGGSEENIKLSREYEKELYPKCDINITVGRYLAAEMSEEYKKDFKVIYSCMSEELSVDKTRKVSDLIFKEHLFNVPADAKIAIFQGSLTNLRNLENMMRATKYLAPKEYLIVVGGGKILKKLKKILQKEGKPSQVKFVGWVKQNELLQYTMQADVGVLPYYPINEYFSCSVPNKIMEFFEAELPVLYDKRMKEIDILVGDNEVGRAAILSDPDEFGKVLHEMLNNKSELLRYKKNYTGCKDDYNFESQRKRFEKMIKQTFFI